jgi:hypothetical protein
MKRNRSDSASAAVEAAQIASAELIEPPDHVTLRDGDRSFWNSIVSARARDSWNNADLENAANLARCKADIERLQREITSEGDVVQNERGTQIINPKHTLLETLSRRAVAISRMLHVHAEATVGESGDQTKRVAAEKKAKAAVKDDLIPRLSVVK